MELFTERLKLKDILPEIATEIAKEYDFKEEDIELVRKNNPLRAEDIKIEDGERAAVRYVNTADVDRDNEIVMPDGLQVKDFLKSPSVLYAHDYRGLPIGKDIWLKLIKGKGWLAKTIYAKHELATDVYNLVKDKFLNTNSIGFIPLESVKPDSKKWDKTKAKLMAEYGIKEKLIDKVGRIYTQSILLEHSDVPIPSNINALNVAVGKGFIKSDQLIKDLEIEIIDKEDEVELSKEGKKKLEEGLKDVKEGKVTEVNLDELEKEIDDKGEAIKLEDVEKPYPGEHACRIKSPGLFQPGSFRRMTRRSNGKVYSIIMGRLKGETTLTEQAYRYGIKVWTVNEARKHCKDHKGIAFEPATGKEEEDTIKDTKKEDAIKLAIKYGELLAKKDNLELKIELIEQNVKELEIELEEKAGAVLNRKNKADLVEAQKRIQNVLDSAVSAEEEGKQAYNCECIKCGHKITSDKHCDTLKCPKCGGKMRRVERPGPGKETDELEIEEQVINIETNNDGDDETEEHLEEKEETIDIDEDELKEIISQVLNEQTNKLAETLKKEVGDNFKKMTGKVI